MTLLQQRDLALGRRREELRLAVLERLREVLPRWLGWDEVWVFGSVVRPGQFREGSDVDIALEREPEGVTIYRLQAELSEVLGREVDVVLLSESRFAEAVRREGQRWTRSN
ncbi:MAG: nucleotidyltransferase domain-containing protein [Verrucomicrobiae bacterium]|nr:nucleotidyltransferase domain-containing protein [Verrucomicrobiae bacterium]